MSARTNRRVNLQASARSNTDISATSQVLSWALSIRLEMLTVLRKCEFRRAWNCSLRVVPEAMYPSSTFGRVERYLMLF
eukprot:13755008-Heterocapsa_arctica.AAC.1